MNNSNSCFHLTLIIIALTKEKRNLWLSLVRQRLQTIDSPFLNLKFSQRAKALRVLSKARPKDNLFLLIILDIS